MSTETETDTTPDPKPETTAPSTQRPASTPAPKDADGYAAAFKAMQADLKRLEDELDTRDKKLSELVKDRDKLAKERDSFASQVDGFTRRDRESELIGRVRKDIPGADPLALRGVLAVLHEGGKIDRFPPAEQLEETAKKAIELIKTEAPGLTTTRAPMPGGGTNGVPPRTQPPRYQGPFALQKK